MRLLLICNDFPNPYEPTRAVFNLNLVRALAVRHEVTVIAPIIWGDEWRARRRGADPICRERRSLVEGIEVHYPRYVYPPGMLRSTYGWWFWQSVRRTVRRAVGDNPPDAVVGYWIHPDGRAAVRAAKMYGVPSAVLVGGSDLLVLTRSRSRRREVIGVLRDTDAILTVNDHLKDKVHEYGIPADKVHVRPQGVNTTTFCPGDRTEARVRLGLPVSGPVLLWVGRMAPVKGLDVLLRACARLRDGGTVFNLYLVGDGPLRGELETAAARLGLAGAVSFLGARPQAELPDWYRAADVTVLPSRSEGLPNVLRESLACGTPFVASNVGGIPEIAEPPLDRLVPPDDPAALAGAIAGSLREPSALSRTKFQPLSWAESADTLTRILEPLVARNTGPRAPREVGAACS
jgi:teichuronic acid biosynthesis glycosyltransferase TuaC